jgi:phosphatidylglycerophosphate synthase
MSLPPIVHRVNTSLLSGGERRLLLAIAARLPRSVTPDGLTGFGVLGAAVVLIGYVASANNVQFLWLANAGLIMHWFGDSLDGTVARFRQIERQRYGFFVDQTIDVVGNLLIALGVGFSPWARLDVALLFLTAFHMVSICSLVRGVVDQEFHIAVGRFGVTEVRLGIFGLNIGILIFGAPPFVWCGYEMTWCDVFMTIVTVGIMGLFAWEFTTHAKRLAKIDPPTA